MENNRPQRRTKIRPPYDLRKKVLLKNFLREQMSPLPGQSPSNSTSPNEPDDTDLIVDNLAENNVISSEIEIKDSENHSHEENATIVKSGSNIDNSQNSNSNIHTNRDSNVSIVEHNTKNASRKPHSNSPWRCSIVFDFSKVTESKLSQFKSVKRNCPTLTDEEAKEIADKNSVHFSPKSQSDKELSKDVEKLKTSKHKQSKFSSSWKRKENNDPHKLVGITKAKNKFKKSKLQEKTPSKFKDKIKKVISGISDVIVGKTNKRTNDFSSLMPEPGYAEAHKTYSRNPETVILDMSWSLNEIRKLEKANKLLREENEMLSQSITSIMADVNVAFNSFQRQPNSLDKDVAELNNMSFNRHPVSHVSDPKCRVLRSRSVHYRSERRREIKSRLSSQSMCHPQYCRIPPRPLYRAKPCVITPDSSERTLYPVSPIISKSLGHHSSRSLIRRSSLPEKNNLRPLINRRPSGKNTSFSRNLLSLPTDAFY